MRGPWLKFLAVVALAGVVLGARHAFAATAFTFDGAGRGNMEVMEDTARRWISVADAAERAGVTVQTVRAGIRTGQVGAVRTKARHRNGVPRRLVAVDSLPTDRAAPALPVPAVARVPAKRVETLPARQPFRQLPLLKPDLPDFIPVTRDGALDVGAALELGLDSQLREWNRRMAAVADWRAARDSADYGNLVALGHRVAARHNTSRRTLLRWAKLLDEGGPVALVPAWGASRGRLRAMSLELRRAVREAFLDQRRRNVAELYRSVVIPLCSDDGCAAPHISTVRRFVREYILPLARVAFRHGERAFRARMEPKVTRCLPERVNDAWSMDWRLCDVLVYPPGKDRHSRATRPWMMVIVDVKSACIVASRLALRPNSADVALAVRSALLTFGTPETIQRDNDWTLRGKRLGGPPARLRRPRKSDLEGADRWACPASCRRGRVRGLARTGRRGFDDIALPAVAEGRRADPRRLRPSLREQLPGLGWR